ncbi:hypothetical protein [Pseudomonas serbica]|uniref:hypothetical protein n=1 Tax=Pseudomonas serbica TaxID=2965074 RepID=UPI00237B0047|nr:hypothetical protein [Pseudomonas serbica]
MSVSFHTVRSLNGLKNRAKTLAAERSLGHMKSLDIAAQELGYSSYKKAQQVLPASMTMIRVKVRWHEPRYNLKGSETLEYPFIRPLGQMLAPAKGRRRQRLGMFVMTSPNVLEVMYPGFPMTQVEARRRACQTIRELMLMEALDITPAPARINAWPTEIGTDRHKYEVRMPGTDHYSVWVTQQGAALIVNEPYHDNSGLPLQAGWCADKGYDIVTPTWPGMWNPEIGTRMSILARKDSGLDLQDMAKKLDNLPNDFSQSKWPGLSL